MRFESKRQDGLTKNSVSLSEQDFVDDISDKLTRARRLFSLRDYDSCEELARQVLDLDPENSTAKALFQLTSLNRPSRKRLQRIVDPQLPKEDQTHPDKAQPEPKSCSAKLVNVPTEPITGELSEETIGPLLHQERQSQPQRGAITGHPSVFNSDIDSSEHQPALSEGYKPEEGSDPKGTSGDEAGPEDTPYPIAAVTPNPESNSSAEDLREKTIAALVDFLNEKSKSNSQLVPQAADEESLETGMKCFDPPAVSPPERIEPHPNIKDESSIRRGQEEAVNSPKRWGEINPVRTPESRAEDYMASAVSYYYERRLPEALAAAREALHLVSGHKDAREFVNFIQKRLHERKKRKRWAVAMLLVWLLVGLLIWADRGRNDTIMIIHNLLNSVHPATPKQEGSDPNDLPKQTASPTATEDKSILPALGKPIPKIEDKYAESSKEQIPTTAQMKSSATELSPEDVVKTFYSRAAADDFAGAWELAGPGFRKQLKSFERFRNAQRSLESIEFLSAEMASETNRRVTVRFETIATHTNRIDHCKGSVSLVRKGPNRSWVLNWANGIRCESEPRDSIAVRGK